MRDIKRKSKYLIDEIEDDYKKRNSIEKSRKNSFDPNRFCNECGCFSSYDNLVESYLYDVDQKKSFRKGSTTAVNRFEGPNYSVFLCQDCYERITSGLAFQNTEDLDKFLDDDENEII